MYLHVRRADLTGIVSAKQRRGQKAKCPRHKVWYELVMQQKPDDGFFSLTVYLASWVPPNLISVTV
jgi:hypothetical protein